MSFKKKRTSQVAVVIPGRAERLPAVVVNTFGPASNAGLACKCADIQQGRRMRVTVPKVSGLGDISALDVEDPIDSIAAMLNGLGDINFAELDDSEAAELLEQYAPGLASIINGLGKDSKPPIATRVMRPGQRGWLDPKERYLGPNEVAVKNVKRAEAGKAPLIAAEVIRPTPTDTELKRSAPKTTVADLQAAADRANREAKAAELAKRLNAPAPQVVQVMTKNDVLRAQYRGQPTPAPVKDQLAVQNIINQGFEPVTPTPIDTAATWPTGGPSYAYPTGGPSYAWNEGVTETVFVDDAESSMPVVDASGGGSSSVWNQWVDETTIFDAARPGDPLTDDGGGVIQFGIPVEQDGDGLWIDDQGFPVDPNSVNEGIYIDGLGSLRGGFFSSIGNALKSAVGIVAPLAAGFVGGPAAATVAGLVTSSVGGSAPKAAVQAPAGAQPPSTWDQLKQIVIDGLGTVLVNGANQIVAKLNPANKQIQTLQTPVTLPPAAVQPVQSNTNQNVPLYAAIGVLAFLALRK